MGDPNKMTFFICLIITAVLSILFYFEVLQYDRCLLIIAFLTFIGYPIIYFALSFFKKRRRQDVVG